MRKVGISHQTHAYQTRSYKERASSSWKLKVIHLWRLKIPWTEEYTLDILLFFNTILHQFPGFQVPRDFNKTDDYFPKNTGINFLKKIQCNEKNPGTRFERADAWNPTWMLLEAVGGSRWKTAGASDRSRVTGYQRVPGGSARTGQQRI